MRPSVPILLAALICAACSPDATEDAGTPVRSTTEREAIRDEDGRTLAVLAGKTLYLSGVQPSDVSAPIAGQTTAAMGRLGQTLERAGLDYSHVVSCHVHLADMDHYSDMNSVYGSFFDEGGYPARTTLEVAGLPEGAGILLMCIAYSDATEIEVVRPPETEIPPAMGPYSPAVRAGRTIYLSGQGGRNPTTGELADSTSEQAEQTLRTIGTILEAAGLAYDNTVLANSYFPPASEAGAIDSAYEDIFDPGGAPSRANVALSRLPGDIAVEITFVAVNDNYVTRLFMHNQVPVGDFQPGFAEWRRRLHLLRSGPRRQLRGTGPACPANPGIGVGTGFDGPVECRPGDGLPQFDGRPRRTSCRAFGSLPGIRSRPNGNSSTQSRRIRRVVGDDRGPVDRLAARPCESMGLIA